MLTFFETQCSTNSLQSYNLTYLILAERKWFKAKNNYILQTIYYDMLLLYNLYSFEKY